MIVDSSSLVAILFNGDDADLVTRGMADDAKRLMSAVSYLEACIVVEARYGEAGGRELDLLLHKADIQVVAVTPEQAELARSAYRRFGQGRRRGGMGFVDAFTFALAQVSGEPLMTARKGGR